MYSDEEEKIAWIPDLVGPIYKSQNPCLREVLHSHRDDKFTRMMATFIPDEVIYEADLNRKSMNKFNAVLALIKVSRFFEAYEKYTNGDNGGSYAFFALLSNYIGVVIEEVYNTTGDVLKFSRDGLLVMWKISRDEFTSKVVYNVILCAQRIQEEVAALRHKNLSSKVDFLVSAGEVAFSVIGDETAKNYVLGGTPIMDLKYAKRICLPGDLVLSSSAWEHCAPSQYDYVIKDSSNIKIIKVLGPPMNASLNGIQDQDITTNRVSSRIAEDPSEIFSLMSNPSSVHSESETICFQARSSVVEALRRGIGPILKSYILPPVLKQINREQPLEYLREVKQITVVCVNVIPSNTSAPELIPLIDEAYKVIQSIAGKHCGYVYSMNLYDKDVLFYVSFGLEDSPDLQGEESKQNAAKNGITAAGEIMAAMKRNSGVKASYIGISTGMAFCGVIGHMARRQYMVLGPPIDKALGLMSISYDKISCDYDAIFYSCIGKERFRTLGMNVLKGFGKCQVYEYIQSPRKKEGDLANLDYSYPILGRFQELECFKDVLDEIGVSGRSYAGVLVEVGPERSGKSRLLDAYAKIVRSRQLKLLQIPLHASYADKAYSVLYHILLELFDAEDCTTVDDRERALLSKFSNFLAAKDFCYLNTMMRVHFPLSNEYCSNTDWKRHKKTLKIFDAILAKVAGRACILLDNVQNMDLMSWQFLSTALNNDNIVVAMTLLEPISWDNITQVEAAVSQDKRLMQRSLVGLNPDFHAAFACQFLNVKAVPTSLEKILQKRSKNSISWCETFLMSVLQVYALNFITISPIEVSHYDLIFPDEKLLMKTPPDLMPEELPPPLHWSQMSSLNVCVMSEKPLGFVESNRDVTGLRIDIYNRMNTYEQDFIKCGATLGSIFFRRMIKSMMTNYAPLYTAKAVAEMIRLRILECVVVQRKHLHGDDLMYCLLKKRKTFSNMHHQIACECKATRIFAPRNLPVHANCKVLEFTIPAYRKLFYDILPPHEKKEYHRKAVLLFQRDARKCSTCGNGDFLIMPTVEEPSGSSTDLPSTHNLSRQRRGTMHDRSDKYDSRRNFFSTFIEPSKKRESMNIRRISILAVHDEKDDDVLDLPSDTANGYLSDVGRRLRGVSMIIDTVTDSTWESRLKRFKHVDYRNCRCIHTISYLFWQINHHVTSTKNLEQITKFMLQYTAGLIKTKQSTFATKFLSNTIESIETIRLTEQLIVDVPNALTNKWQTLILMGDAHFMSGNYPLAKKHYTEAATMWNIIPQTTKLVCYNSMLGKLRHITLGFPDYMLNIFAGEEAVEKLKLSICLERLSVVQMLQNEPKPAKLTILQAYRAAFESVNGFLEKGKIYLSAVRIFRHFDDLRLIEHFEKPIALMIEEKSYWYLPEEIVVVAKVYQTMYETRQLHGHLRECIDIGYKILKICNYLHLSRIKLVILPSLIEMMVWTKSINEAADLLKELYYISKEDVDQSAITWYHALCLEFILDAGMTVETYDVCYDFYTNILVCKSTSCVSRDPESLLRLRTCLGIWQLRKSMIVEEKLILSAAEFVTDIKHNKFSRIYNCVKGLECYLLILKRRINIKRSSDICDHMTNANTIIKVLKDVGTLTPFARPFLYLLQSYMHLLRGRKSSSQRYMEKSEKWALKQENKMILSWMKQNRRTWKEANYNNMAYYWLEYVTTGESVKWQEIENFSLEEWSTIMYPLPVPAFNI